MSLYSVIRQAGPGFIDGGIAGTETDRLRALLIMSADGEDEIRRLNEDRGSAPTDESCGLVSNCR